MGKVDFNNLEVLEKKLERLKEKEIKISVTKKLKNADKIVKK